MIKVLDTTTLSKANKNSITSLFIQEHYHLQSVHSNSVLTQTLDISDQGKVLACTTLPYVPLSLHINKMENIIDLNDPHIIAKFIRDMISDVMYLWDKLKMRNVMTTLGLENICYIKEKKAFFLSNWVKLSSQLEVDSSRFDDFHSFQKE